MMKGYYPTFLTDRLIKGRFDETCQGTVPLCFRLFLESSSFEDAIRRAVSWGGDSDTNAAIVGLLAEACFDVPKEISGKIFGLLPTDMLNVIGDFFHLLNQKNYT